MYLHDVTSTLTFKERKLKWKWKPQNLLVLVYVIALAGVGVGIGNIFAALVNAIGRNRAKNEVFGIGILGFALTEAVALFALVIALLLLYTF